MGKRETEKKRIPLNQAVRELQKHSKMIKSVNEWAYQMGYSRSYFSRRIKTIFGNTPKQILADKKLERIKKEIADQPNTIGYTIAINVGLEDEKAMYKFLITHFNTTLTALRQELP